MQKRRGQWHLLASDGRHTQSWKRKRTFRLDLMIRNKVCQSASVVILFLSLGQQSHFRDWTFQQGKPLWDLPSSVMERSLILLPQLPTAVCYQQFFGPVLSMPWFSQSHHENPDMRPLLSTPPLVRAIISSALPSEMVRYGLPRSFQAKLAI